MNDTLLGGLLALGGVFIGGCISLIVEALRHRWTISDRRYGRKKEIVDRRCDQAETFVQAVTRDFRSMMHDIEAYLTRDDPHDAPTRHAARLYWKDQLDTRIFAIGPSIRALSDEDLMRSWDLMMEQMDKLQQQYGQVWEFRFEDKPLDIDDPISEVNQIWADYARNLGAFYSRIDELRLKFTEA
jgi:hypothetical protein